jgi:non-heme chloroperoxidase
MVLAGFSMGTGEVTRYLGTYGSPRVAKAVLMGAIPPFLLKTSGNSDGVDQSVFDGIKAAVIADRPAYFKDFLDNFYNVDVLRPGRISDQAWQNSFIVAVGASAYAAYACVIPGSPTSAPTCPRSTSRPCSSTGTPTGSCRMRPPPPGCRR